MYGGIGTYGESIQLHRSAKALDLPRRAEAGTYNLAMGESPFVGHFPSF